MVSRDEQAKIDKRITLSMQRDEWDHVHFPELTAEENADIRIARRLGYATFYCASGAEASAEQARKTLKGARAWIKERL